VGPADDPHARLILPWRAAALERYKMRHSHYGDLQGSFEGRGWEFFKRGWWLWLLDADRHLCQPARALRLRRVQGDRMALVAVRHPVRRRALESSIAEERADRPVLESDRLDRPAGLVFSVYLALCAVLVASMSGEGLRSFSSRRNSCRAFRCWCWSVSAIWSLRWR
jgi:hypothetical protein